MAAWREQELERTIGGTLDKDTMTAEAVRALAENFAQESELIDFKSRGAFASYTRNDRTWNQSQERAKDVCAFANGRGGVIVFGVEDIGKEPDIDRRLRPFDPGDAQAALNQYRKDVRQYTRPTPRFDMFPVPTTDGHYYLVAVIPPSFQAPHAVLTGPDDRRAHLYFVRATGESHTRVLAEYEVADRYQARFRSAEDRRRNVERVWSAGVDMVRSSNTGIWVAVSVVPDVPVPGTLTAAARREIDEWDKGQKFPDGALGMLAQLSDYPFPAPGYIEYTQRQDDDGTLVPTATTASRALHADGSGFAALRIADHDALKRETEIKQDLLLDALTASVPHLLDWTAHRSGQWGNATVATALIDGDRSIPSDAFSKALRIDKEGHGTVYGLRTATRFHRPTVAADLSAAVSKQDHLAITYSLSSSLLQMFGRAEPELITESGSIREGFGYPNKCAPHVQDWAQRHSVPLDGSGPPA